MWPPTPSCAQPGCACSPQGAEQHVLLVLPLLRAQQAARHHQHRLRADTVLCRGEGCRRCGPGRGFLARFQTWVARLCSVWRKQQVPNSPGHLDRAQAPVCRAARAGRVGKRLVLTRCSSSKVQQVQSVYHSYQGALKAPHRSASAGSAGPPAGSTAPQTSWTAPGLRAAGSWRQPFALGTQAEGSPADRCTTAGHALWWIDFNSVAQE